MDGTPTADIPSFLIEIIDDKMEVILKETVQDFLLLKIKFIAKSEVFFRITNIIVYCQSSLEKPG